MRRDNWLWHLPFSLFATQVTLRLYCVLVVPNSIAAGALVENLMPFRLLAAAVVIMAATVSGYYRHRAERAGGAVSRAGEGLVAAVLLRVFGGVAWLALFAYVVHPQWVAWAQVPLPYWLRALGACAALAGVPLMWWVFRSLGLNVSDTVGTRNTHTLVTAGPYHWIRHPLYSFGFLLFGGLTLMAANALIAVAAIGALVVLLRRTGIEEAMLIERFGDQYVAYTARTGRFVPVRR